jgi:hypothetical protein
MAQLCRSRCNPLRSFNVGGEGPLLHQIIDAAATERLAAASLEERRPAAGRRGMVIVQIPAHRCGGRWAKRDEASFV